MTIRTWQACDRNNVINLIVGIQTEEFDLALTAAEQPDLSDVDSFYRSSGGEFWVALDNGAVVGTIAIARFDSTCGAIRKMFVAPSHRGQAELPSN
jgi:hypothetical protein